MLTRLAASAVAAVALAACGGTSDPPGPRPTTFGGNRPVTLQVPEPLEDGKLYPLVLLLHGYGANAFVQQSYFGMKDLAPNGDALVLAPDGTPDSSNRQFWNADGFCCDFEGRKPDDVGYLGGMIDDVMAAYPVDPARVLAIGHSNGAWMSYRMACERSDVFTDVIALAGNTAAVPCEPPQPVHILHLHGTADDTVPYTEANVDAWAAKDGCTGARAATGELDLDTALAGAETRMSSTAGCPAGGAVDLWRIEGAGHVPNLSPQFRPAVWSWFLDHPRP
ncbi:MAG: hypothetical protein KF773_22200 [Deltaproteobacteria bacterium]|nr:hypothetical protein [Deltaproteobacteria bacterium]